MRRVTVRRGRVVPSSQHLSLTGSKFGMRQFGLLADNESTMTGRRSPFEWWNTIIDRSQSRLDQMSQMETASIVTRPTSRATTNPGRRELHSTPTPTPEKKKEPVTKVWEVTLPPQSPSPSPSPLGPNKAPNFSRSFSNRAPSSPLTQRSQATLSRISERSGHQSFISTIDGPHMPSPSRSSHHSAINPLDSTPLPGQASHYMPTTPRRSMTFAASTPRNRPTTQWPSTSPELATSDQTMPPTSWRTPSRDPSFEVAPRLSLPKPVAKPKSPLASNPDPSEYKPPTTNSFYSQTNVSRPDLTSTQTANRSTPDLASSSRPHAKSLPNAERSGISYEPQVPRTYMQSSYWASRTDLHNASTPEPPKTGHFRHLSSDSRYSSPDQYRKSTYTPDDSGQETVMGIVTVPGKRNTKVLRKKSLKRMQVVSSLEA
jgi:hypothetical protein